MNKFFMIMLFAVSFANAMELTITDKENTDFVRHLGMAVGFGNKIIEQNDLASNNPIQFIVKKIKCDLEQSNYSLAAMIKHQDLHPRLEIYGKVDSDPTIRFALDQIHSGGGDVKEAESYVIRTRRILSGLELKKLQPSYSGAWIGELQTNNRIAFMKRNENYPLDEKAIKDYIAMFIYQTLFSVRIPCPAKKIETFGFLQPVEENFGATESTGKVEPIRHSFGGKPEGISGYHGDNGQQKKIQETYLK